VASSGLTPTGLVIEMVDDIRSGVQSDLRTTFFASLPVGDKDLLGHMVGIISNELGLLWERLEDVNSSQDPDKATGPALDALSALTGSFRQPATASSAIVTCCGTPTTTIAAGAVIQTASSQQNFDTIDTVVIAALAAWATSTTYAIGNRVTANARCYQAVVGGASASSGSGPASTSQSIPDGTGTLVWQYLGEGTGAVDVEADCEVTGPTQATALDLSVIQTPAFGWSSALNVNDATLGDNESSDEELRLLRQIELSGTGATTGDSLRAQMLKVEDVVSCTVFTNTGDTTNGDGLPPHSFETLVLGGADQDVVDTIADNMPAGIQTYSSTSTSGTHIDSQGNPITIYYTRPTDISVYVDITVNYDASQYPSDGDVEIQDAITTWGANFTTGRDVVSSAVGAQAFSVPGVLGVPQVLIYTDVINPAAPAWAPTTAYVDTAGAPSCVVNDGGRVYVCVAGGTSAGSGGPTGTGTSIADGGVTWSFLGATIPISLRDLAIFSSNRIAVHSSAITP
jgi:uncharacterized phage protein gp47/JayE